MARSANPDCRQAVTSVGNPTPTIAYDANGVSVRVSPLDGASKRVMPAVLSPKILRLCLYLLLAGHLKNVLCTTLRTVNPIGLTLRMTSTKLSEIVVHVDGAAELRTNNVSSAYSRRRITNVRGHGQIRSVVKDEIRKPHHGRDDGPLLKIDPGDTDCSNNC